MRFYHFLLLVLPFLAFTSCDDDTPQAGPTGEIEEIDNFIGDAKSLTLGAEASGLTSSDITLKILAPDGSIISRHGTHRRNGNESEFTLSNGLKDGTYRLLYVEYPIGDNPDLAHLADKYPTAQYGLGCRVVVNNRAIMVSDGFDDEIGLAGSGTKDDPYIISSYSHLIKLLKYVNSYDTNKKITSETYFKQTNPIDMEQASFECDMRYGWYPIGADTNTPFRGVYIGDELSYLWIDRPNSPGVGLFGYVYNATIDNVKMTNATIKGNFAVGSVAGASISGGDAHGKSTFTNCSVEKSTISGSAQSFAIGGIVGAADMYTQTLIQKCESIDNTITGSYNVGGLIGGCGVFSSLLVGDCSNSSRISGEYSGTGGIVGAADTLYVAGCSNSGPIKGATAYTSGDKNNTAIGSGGICGGSGFSWLSACTNTGEINGADGVGGIIGSTRIKGSDNEAYKYNSTLLRWCSNSGNVSGETCVGGMCGEAEFGCYGVVNSGNISGGDYTAGVVGNTSIAVAHNAVNKGTVTGHNYCSGIVGKTTWGSIALDHNYGKVNGSGSHTAGILGLAGNNTIIHYCGNFGAVAGTGSGPAAGIVAEIGDPREWSAMNITECVIGSLELVMVIAGPAIAIAEHFIEATAEGIAVALKVTEITFDAIINATERCLLGYGIKEILTPEIKEELSNSLQIITDETCTKIKDEIAATRNGFSDFSAGDFDKSCYITSYNNEIASTLGYYETEGNDEIFNENINKSREERMEELEKAHEESETIHEFVAGVSIMFSTIALVGSAVLSGGAAVPFIIMGSCAAAVGGANAISKGAMDFEENAVIISQCVNAGAVSSTNDKAAGIVGILQDNSLVTDCLNSADLKQPLAYDTKSKTRIKRCLVLNKTNGDFHTGGCDEIVYYSPSSVFDHDVAYEYSKSNKLPLSAGDIANPGSYKRSGSGTVAEPGLPNGTYYWSIHWDIGGSKSRWKVGEGSGNVFPTPAYSEMRN